LPGALDRETVPVIGVLASIWERVLQRSPIGHNDNFFDVGGTPSLAIRLLAEVKNVCGRDLPLELIPRTPTVASMTVVLEQPNQSPSSPVVLLRAGNQQPPIFIVHGLDGGLVKMMPMIRRISTARPVYGIQAPGFWGEPPIDRIEAMATSYLEAVRQIQAHGPYCLVGYSFGGLVTHEMARLLASAGEKVGQMIMLDTYPHLRHLRFVQRIRLILRRANRHFAEMGPMHPFDSLSYVKRRMHNRSRVSKAAAERQALQSSPNLSSHEASQLVRGRAEVALGFFRPQAYSGEIYFLQGGTDTYFPKDPAAIWAHLSSKFEYEVVPGDHLTMLSDHFEKVAEVLSRVLRQSENI